MTKSGSGFRSSGAAPVGTSSCAAGWPAAVGRAARLGSALLALCLAAACEPTVNSHGHVWRGMSPQEIQVGIDTRATVLQRLGSPTAEGLEQGTPWIYVTERELARGARSAVPLEQQAVVIRFDAQDRVVSVEEFGSDDRLAVEISPRETPARGRELTLLQQLLGNVGRFETQ